MAYEMGLPAPYPAQKWKVKIRDRERTEEPHVTILHKTRNWRFSLRKNQFLDVDPDPRDVPKEIVLAIQAQIASLRLEWDAMYPENPVFSQEEDNDEL